VVISHTPDRPLFSPELDQIWLGSFQSELVAPIDDVTVLVAENSDHWIPRNEPTLLIEAVTSLLMRLDASAPSAAPSNPFTRQARMPL